jgi:hypothetical protein
VQQRVFQYLDAAGLTDPSRTVQPVVVDPTVPLGTGCITTYQVTVTYPHAFSFVGGIAGYFGGSFGSTTLTATSTMRGESAAGGCGP